MKKRRKLILLILIILLLIMFITILVVMPRFSSQAKSYSALKDIKEDNNYYIKDNIENNNELIYEEKKKGDIVYEDKKKEDTVYENVNNKVKTSYISKEKKDNNTNIKSFVSSEGVLTPEFNNKILEYELTIDNNIKMIDFDIELESSKSVVSGNKNIVIDDDIDVVELTVIAEDKSQKIIKIKINKEVIKIDEENITLLEGEEYSINLNNDIENMKYIYTIDNNDIVDVSDEGVITAKKNGSTTITIEKENKSIEKIIIVKVMATKIRSEIYDALEKEEGKIIIGAPSGEKISEFIDKLLNEKSMIEIYDKEGNKIENYDDIVKTGLIVRLVLNDKEYDSAIVIVKGDINEDGVIDDEDVSKLEDHILYKVLIEDYRKYAADLNLDNILTGIDVSKLQTLINKLK